MLCHHLTIVAATIAAVWMIQQTNIVAASSSSITPYPDVEAYYQSDDHQQKHHEDDLAQVLSRHYFNHRRSLAGQRNTNNFNEMNDILENVVVTLPDSTMSRNGLSLDISQLTCRNLYVGDIKLLTATTDYTATRVLNVEVSLRGLDMDCTSRYNYDGWMFTGRGDATISSYNNEGVVAATVTLLPSSSIPGTGESSPTTIVNILNCRPSVNVNSLDFNQNGIMGWILDRAEGLLISIFENVVENKICTSLEDFVQTTFNEEWLQSIVLENLDKYNPSNQPYIDPLQIEYQLLQQQQRQQDVAEEEEGDGTPILRLLDLQDPQTKFGQFVQLGLNNMVSYVNKPTENGDDLKINELLREWMLEPGSNALILDQSDLFDSSPITTTSSNRNNLNFDITSNVLYEGSNSIVDVTIKLDQIRLRGLDSLKAFDPLEAIGSYTLQNSLIWDYLAFDIDLILVLKPSSSSDSIVEMDKSSSQLTIEEKITLQWSIEDINAIISVALGINQSLLETMKLGTLLQNAQQILPCFLSTIYTIELSTLFVSAQNIIKIPTITGFISSGLDSLLSSTLEGSFELFENMVLDASPSFFQQEIKDVLQLNLIDKYKTEALLCTPYAGGTATTNNGDTDEADLENATDDAIIVDWRDLLLSPAEAIQAGATGTSPYGDVMSSFVMPALKDQILTNHEQLNEKIIKTFTLEQSGIEGTLSFPSATLFQYIDDGVVAAENLDNTTSESSAFENNETSILSTLWDRFEFKISNVRLHNLDTVSTPVSLLEPMPDNSLFNKLKLGNERENDGSFGVTVRVLLQVEGPDGVEMHNELDVTFAIPSVSLELDFIANLDADALMNFPLIDVTDIHCWLAAIADQNNTAVKNDMESSSSSFYTVTEEETTRNNIEMEYQKFLIDGSTLQSTNLALTAFSMVMSSFTIDSSCVSCSSPGGHFVSEILNALDRVGCYILFNPRLTTLLEEVIWKFSTELPIENILKDSPKYCRHHGEYDSNATATVEGHDGSSWPQLSLPGLSSDGVETVLALGLVTIYSSMMVTAKNHLYFEPVPEMLGVGDVDFLPDDAFPKYDPPLPPQDDGVADESTGSNNADIIDWTDLSSTFGDWADTAFEEFREFLHDVVPARADTGVNIPVEPKRRRTSQGGEELRFNQLLRNYALDDDLALVVDLDNVVIPGTGFDLQVSQVRVFGLDTISHMDILRVEGPTKFTNEMLLERIDVMVDVNVVLAGLDQPQPMTLSYSLRDIYAEFDFSLALDMVQLGNVELGSILELGNIFYCAMSGVHALNFSKMEVAVGAIETPDVHKFFSSELRDSLTWIIESLFDEYRADLIAAVPIIFDTTLRDSINKLLPALLQSAEGRCTHPRKANIGEGFLDFRDLFLCEDMSKSLGGRGDSPYGQLVRTIYDILDQGILVNGASLNEMLGDWTESFSNVTGLIEVPDGGLEGDASLSLAGLHAKMGFKIWDLAIRNLDSLGEPLEMARPVMNEANVLNNTVSFGVGDRPLQVDAMVMLSLNDGNEMQIRNEMSVSLEVDRASILASVLLRVSESSFMSFPLRDMTNINCWLSTILSSQSGNARTKLSGISLVDHSITIANLTLDVDCASCTSPRFDELVQSLYTPRDIEGTTNIIHAKTEQVYDGKFLEALLARVVTDAAKQCPHREEYDPEATYAEFMSDPGKSLGFADKTQRDSKSIYFNIANTVIVVGLFTFGVSWRRMVRKRSIAWVHSLSPEGSYLLSKQQAKEREKEAMLNATTTSLFRSKGIPKRVRMGVPLAILLNAVLYLVGHLGVLSTVDIDATLAGEAFTVREFLQFSFIDSTRSTYHNGGSEMVILIWLFTGVWPYIKMILSLLAWTLPPSKLSVSRRGQILLWIDAMAKLSVVDVFTMILGVAVLLVYFGGPDKSMLNQDALYTMKAIVTPGAACYCILIAQRMARVSSRYFLQYHQQVIDISVSEHELKIHRMHSLLPEPDDIEQTKMDQESEERKEAHGLQDTNEDDQVENTPPPQLPIFPTQGGHDEDFDKPNVPPRDLFRGFQLPLREESKGEECSSSGSRQSQEVDGISEDRECSSDGSDGQQDDSGLMTDPWSCFSPGHDGYSSDDDSRISASNERDEDFRWGSMGVFFAGVTVVAIFLIAIAFGPSVSLDMSDVFVATLESDQTFEETAPAYGVFAVISFVLLKARFVLDTTSDYIGLGFFLIVGFVAVGMTFFFQLYQFFRTRKEQRRRGLSVSPLCYWPFRANKRNYKTNKEYDLPYYLSMHKWKHLEIYLISISIGVWQLGSIAMYAIHLYCDILSRSYEVLAYVGLVEYSNAQCFRIQAKLPGNLLIIGLSFCILVVSFMFEVSAQVRKNIKDVKSLIREEDAEHLSIAWHPEKHDESSRRQLSSRLDATFSMDHSYYDEGEDHTSSEHFTKICTPPRPIGRTRTFESTGTSSTEATTPKSTSSSEGEGLHAFDEYGSFL